MHFRPSNAPSQNRGLTLIEVTLVVATLLGLISVLFIGVGSYKEGSNRAVCVQQVASMQKAMRSYCNMHQIEPGQSVSNLKSRTYYSAKWLHPSGTRLPQWRRIHFHREPGPDHGSPLHVVLYSRTSAVE